MRKKFYIYISLILAIIFLVSNSILVFANSDSAYKNSDYQIYNLSSGEINYQMFDNLPGNSDSGFSPGYFPNGVVLDEGGELEPAAVVGEDTRDPVDNTTVGPYCNTVYIETTYSSEPNTVYIGTGFVLGPSAVVTAAHCVYNESRGGYAQTVKIVPAKNGTIEPYGREVVYVSANNVVVSTGFINSPGPDNDWAIVELTSDIGNTTGWLGLRWQSASYNGTGVVNTGYPVVVDNVSTNRQMYAGSGIIRESYDKKLIGTMDASGGNSGGPVFIYSTSNGYTAIGILTSGSDDVTFGEEYPTAYSTVTRITQDMYNLFVTYR